MNEELERLGWDDERAREAAEHPGRPGRVVRQDRGWVQVALDDGIDSFRTRNDRVGTPVVGDWVVVVDDEVSVVLERHSALRRADPVGEGEQVLAANLDRVLVVAGLDRPVKAGRIHRAVAQSWDAGAEPLLVLTKADLVDGLVDDLVDDLVDGPVDDVAAVVAGVAAEHPGLDVVAVSAVTGAGIADLRDGLAGQTVVLIGESGAGKSSLLNALGEDALAETGDVRAHDAKGRHTTTRRELHQLPGGGIVVDTPGVRAIGLFAEPHAIDSAFPDVEELAASCRFSDCSHEREPGCAVLAAVDAGDLDGDRLIAFRDLHAEAEWALLPEHERRRHGRR